MILLLSFYRLSKDKKNNKMINDYFKLKELKIYDNIVANNIIYIKITSKKIIMIQKYIFKMKKEKKRNPRGT